MAANTVLNLGSGGDTIQTFDNTTFKTQAVAIVGSTGATSVAVKAASTAAAATDPALVVAVSPNNTIAATQSGTWNIGTITALPTIVTNADGTIGAGTAPSKSLIGGGIYNTPRITLTNGQGAALQLDADGSQYVNCIDWTVASSTVLGHVINDAGSALIGKVGFDQTTVGTTNAVAIAQIGATTILTGGVNGSQGIGGLAADNATVAGNPVWVCGSAIVGANPTKSTNGQTSALATDAAGRLITVGAHERTMVGMQQTSITSSTAETTIVTAIASTFCDITSLAITNGSATATIFTLKDSTAGTTRAIYNLSAGGGVVINFNPPLPQATVNNNWTGTCGTSVASVYVSVVYVKNT